VEAAAIFPDVHTILMVAAEDAATDTKLFVPAPEEPITPVD
jgi:hypothetical protein